MPNLTLAAQEDVIQRQQRELEAARSYIAQLECGSAGNLGASSNSRGIQQRMQQLERSVHEALFFLVRQLNRQQLTDQLQVELAESEESSNDHEWVLITTLILSLVRTLLNNSNEPRASGYSEQLLVARLKPSGSNTCH